MNLLIHSNYLLIHLYVSLYLLSHDYRIIGFFFKTEFHFAFGWSQICGAENGLELLILLSLPQSAGIIGVFQDAHFLWH